MLVVRRVSYASVIEAQSAVGVAPDPRDIAEVDSVEQGVNVANDYFKESGYQGDVEIIDYTPHTAFCSTKRKRLRLLSYEEIA